MSTLDPAHIFAALSGPFEPLQAFAPATRHVDVAEFAMAATQLADACDTSPQGAGQRWLLRTSVRHVLLKSLSSEQLALAVSERRASEVDPETADLLAVLLDEPPLARADIEAIVGAADNAARLERVIVALDRAGDTAPAHALLAAARAALTELQRAQARQRVVERGFVGRETEMETIEAWLAAPVDTAPVTCLFLSGAPGIGKSTLLAEALRRSYDKRHPLVLRLDFDRAGLDVRDLVGLTMEAARQLAEQMGGRAQDLVDARLEAGSAPERSVKSQLTLRQILPSALANKLGEAVTDSGRPVLVVLDTLEVLRGRGETHPESLFVWLDSLLTRGVRPMSVLAAGRGDALDGLRQIADGAGAHDPDDSRSPRVKRLQIGGLEDEAAKALLDKLGAPLRLWPELLELANGHPLKLRLGAEIARRTGLDHLPRGRRRKEVDAAFLYRFLLSRIEEPDLQRLAHPGLIVRRINAELIRDVLAPQLKLHVSTQRAQELLQQLAAQHWLVEPDPGAPGFLKHRGDMRALLLPLLYRTAPAQAARIDAAAVRWFAALSQPWAQVEALYHELQLSRRGRAAPSVPIELAALFDDEMLAELPQPAADLVRSTRGGRTSQFRGPASAAKPWGDDTAITRELLSLVDRQDWLEGRYVVRQIVDDGGIDLRSQAADAVRTFLWRSGQWALARRWLAERDRFDASDSDIVGMPEQLALARLEMRAEFDPEGLRRRAPWRDMGEKLRDACFASSDKVARHGALALVLANVPEPIHFPARDSREANPVAAAGQRWLGAVGNDLRFAEDLTRDRSNRFGLLQARLRKGWVLASLTPYVAIVHNLSVPEDKLWMSDAAKHTLDVLVRGGSARPAEAQLAPQNVPIGWLSDVGLLAEWAEVTAFGRRDADLLLIARAAERWRRTMAGDWSIGRRRGGWRGLPALDETLSQQLQALLDRPASEAQQELHAWHDGLPGVDLMGQVQRRLGTALAEADKLQEERQEPEFITRRLLARGTPAALAPALAVLAVHRSRHSIGGAVSRRAARDTPTASAPAPAVPAIRHSRHSDGHLVFSHSSPRKDLIMGNDRRLEALQQRLTPGMEAAVRSAIETGRLPHSAVSALPATSLAALSSGQSLESIARSSPIALGSLEAIVQLTGRPPLLVRNDAVVLEPMPELPPETAGLIRNVERWLPSVGRIEFINHDMSWGGTGWVAEHRGNGALVVTNRHVAKLVGRRKADGSAVFVRATSGPRYGAAIDFGEEVGSQAGDNSRTAKLTRFEYLADDTAADVALLWIESAGFTLPTPFSLSTSAVKRDDLVALIGYPAYDSRNDANVQAQYFRDLYEIKRLAPGKILQSPEQGLLTYDCTSLGGNSGSPLLRLDDGKIVGLHFSGLYGVANTAVSADTLEKLLKGERPVSVALRELHVEAPQDGHHVPDHFKDRKGFDASFLGAALPTPWPGLPAHWALDLATPSDHPAEPHELRYRHFGVKYSAKHKLPLITAVNIDGEFSRRIKRGSDKWFIDGRLPAEIQLTSVNFKDAEIDRGHMVRREDPNWGEAQEAQTANDDTFHYVNAAAQHARLNQGKALWQGLENYILDSARTHGFRACIFTGPVLRDPGGDEEEIVIDGATAPLEFWKMVATLDEDGKALHATAYLLSQGQLLRNLLEKRSRREALEGVVLGAYRTFQVAIADLAEATGYDFDAYLAADPLGQASAGQEAMRRGEPVYLTIGELGDIVL